MSAERILIVEDEKAIGELLVYQLGKEGYHQCVHVLSGEKALDEVEKFRPDLIFLDIMLPGMNGLDVCRALKANPDTAGIPIIMLTARDDESDVIVGLELGADDYITKPYNAKLMTARMRAVLRRVAAASTPVRESEFMFVAGPIEMNLLTREVHIGGVLVPFTVSEFNLLYLLASRQDRVFTRNQLVTELRGDDYPVTDRAMDVLVLAVRRKLGEHSALIKTIRGIGYRFSEIKEE
ncbi:MAG: response regulator transcription factor [Planctomycetia bacterium]|nr:response regulator transcription factor [Planctomycetia bacterium]